MKTKNGKGKRIVIYRFIRWIRKCYHFFVPPDIYIDLGRKTY